jgi:hypothetical protein
MGITAEPVRLGISELSVPAGTHLCGFYRGSAERDSLFGQFIREGLRSGDKCLCAVETGDSELVHGGLAAGIDRAVTAGQLDVLSPKEIYLGQRDFSVPDLMGFWDSWAATALSTGGFSFARATGEMTWAITEVIGVTKLVHYETELNRFVPRYPQVMLCLYDLDQFSGRLFFDIMKTHPKVLMGNTVLENLYYIPPDELPAGRS